MAGMSRNKNQRSDPYGNRTGGKHIFACAAAGSLGSIVCGFSHLFFSIVCRSCSIIIG